MLGRLAHRCLLGMPILVSVCVLTLAHGVGAPSATGQQSPFRRPAGESPASWWTHGRASVAARLAIGRRTGHAKNVILFIGDGMGVSTITAARIYDGQSRGESGEENWLSFERFPDLALVKTYESNQQVADSAGTASAMNTGVKTRAGVIDVTGLAHRGNCAEGLAHSIANLGELAKRHGKAVGVVTTTRITHATPAAVYAHTPERDWENDAEMPARARAAGCRDIARQLVEFPDGGIDVALGGGRRNFLGRGLGGRRLAARANLIDEWKDRYKDGVYVSTAGALRALDLSRVHRLLGLFSKSHMTYMLERGPKTDEPTLSEMAAAALDILSRNKNGFYLMVEGGRIDHGHHQGVAEKALSETQEFARAVATAVAKVDLDQTLILVTADHSHVLTISGYPTRGNPILGLVEGNDASGDPAGTPSLAKDGKPYTTLGYQNGPGAVQGPRPRPDTGLGSRQQALVPTYYHSSGHGGPLSETHGGEDVALFAIGPQSYLVGGVIEQNVIFHIIAHAYGWTLPDRLGGRSQP